MRAASQPTQVLFVTLCLVSALAVQAMAQGRGGGGNGNGGNGNGDGGSGGGAIHLIIDFRDGPGDLLLSDGSAYIGGGTDPDIDRAEFDDAGEVRLSFVQKKGKNPPPPARQLRVDLRAVPNPDWGGEPPAFLVDNQAPDTINGFLHVSADADPDEVVPADNVRDLKYGESLPARFPIFSERKSNWEGWKLSFTDSRLGNEEPPLDDRVIVTCVFPMNTEVECEAWKIEKGDAVGKTPYAALVGGGTNESPDAGVWVLPFAIRVCRLDAVANGWNPEDWCEAAVPFP